MTVTLSLKNFKPNVANTIYHQNIHALKIEMFKIHQFIHI